MIGFSGPRRRIHSAIPLAHDNRGAFQNCTTVPLTMKLLQNLRVCSAKIKFEGNFSKVCTTSGRLYLHFNVLSNYVTMR